MTSGADVSAGRPMVGASDREQSYLLEGGNGSCIRLSATAYAVLTGIDGGATPNEVAHDLSRRLSRIVTAEHVEAAYTQVRQQVDAITQRTRNHKPAGLWFRVRLLPVSLVDVLSRRLSGAFHPAVAGPLVLLIFGAIPILIAGMSDHRNMVDPGASFVPLLGLYLVSMFVHELGHASASIRYGAPARDIGFGLYVIYPVFFNDVTAAWGLSRRQRVVIDLAGVFFQLAVGATYLCIHLLTGWELFRLAATSVYFLALFVLLPIFKFDGYWLLSDLLGVVNLSRQVRRVAARIADRLRRRPGTPLPWPRWVSAAVLVYGAFSAMFLGLFVLRLVLTVPHLAAEYPARVAGLGRDLSAAPHTPASGRLASVLGPTYILLGMTLASLAMSRRLINALLPIERRRRRGDDISPGGGDPTR